MIDYEEQCKNMASERIGRKVLDVSVDGKMVLVTDENGHASYQPNEYGPDIGVHEIPVVYLRQYHYVAGTAVQGLAVMRNGKPDPRAWRSLSRYVDLVGGRR